MYLEALGQPIVVLDSLSRATDIYDKRGPTYSDRPYLPILDVCVEHSFYHRRVVLLKLRPNFNLAWR
jgi:hypothetical protein